MRPLARIQNGRRLPRLFCCPTVGDAMSAKKRLLAAYHEEVLYQTNRANRERDRADAEFGRAEYLSAELDADQQELDYLRASNKRLTRLVMARKKRLRRTPAIVVKRGRP